MVRTIDCIQKTIQQTGNFTYHYYEIATDYITGKMREIWRDALDLQISEMATPVNVFMFAINLSLYTLDPGLYSLGLITGFFLQKLHPAAVEKMEKSITDVWRYTGGNNNLIVRINCVSAGLLLCIWVLPYTCIAATAYFSFETSSSLIKKSAFYAKERPST